MPVILPVPRKPQPSQPVNQSLNMSQKSWFMKKNEAFFFCLHSCVLAQLEPSSARRLLHRVQIGLLDWFVIRRYLPTSNQIDVERCLRRMTYTSLKSVSIIYVRLNPRV